jgi:hypothetical protein
MKFLFNFSLGQDLYIDQKVKKGLTNDLNCNVKRCYAIENKILWGKEANA